MKYKVTVCRDVPNFATVEVDAPSEGESEAAALEAVRNNPHIEWREDSPDGPDYVVDVEELP